MFQQVNSPGGIDLTARMGVVLNTFDDLIDHGKSVLSLGYGVVDEFADATGINAGASSGYALASGYLAPPALNVLTGGTASASSNYAGQPAGLAVDGDTGTYWQGDGGGLPKWWQYDVGAGNTANPVKLTLVQTATGGIDAFELLASDTGAFAGEEVSVYSGNAATGGGVQAFTFPAPGPYRNFRVHVTSVHPGASNHPIVSEITLEEAPAALSVQCADQAAADVPATGQFVGLLEAVDPVALNADFTVDLSSDGGATFDRVALTDYGDHGSGIAVVSGDVALTGGGLVPVWKAGLVAGVEARLHAAAMLWG